MVREGLEKKRNEERPTKKKGNEGNERSVVNVHEPCVQATMLPVAQIKCRAAGGEEDDLALTSSRGGRQPPSTMVIVAVSGNPRMTKLIGQRLCAVFLSPREARLPTNDESLVTRTKIVRPLFFEISTKRRELERFLHDFCTMLLN